MSRPPSSPRTWDAVAAVAGAGALSMLALPWYARRICPLGGECGPWEPVRGIEAIGPLSGVALALVAVALMVIRQGRRRRVACAVIAGVAAAVTVFYADLFRDLSIVAEVGPVQAPFWGHVAALVVTAAALAAGAHSGEAGSPTAHSPPAPGP